MFYSVFLVTNMLRGPSLSMAHGPAPSQTAGFCRDFSVKEGGGVNMIRKVQQGGDVMRRAWRGVAAVVLWGAAAFGAERGGVVYGGLEGVWVARSGEIRGTSQVSRVWESVLVLREGTFKLTHYEGGKAGWTGKFVIGTGGDARAVDLDVEAVDFSEIWAGVSYPACHVKGIFETQEGVLRVCLRLGAKLERPEDFVSRDAGTLVATFEPAVEGYAGVPKGVVVKVTDDAGNPAAGAAVFNYMAYNHWGEGGKTEEKATWHFEDVGKTDGTGMAVYTVGSARVVAARDEARHLMGIETVSPALLQHGVVRVAMGRTSEVSGRLESEAMEKMGKAIGWTNIYLLKNGERVGAYEPEEGKFSFALPAGEYVLMAYGENLWEKKLPVVVGGNGSAVELGAIEMPASQRVLMEGKMAPELKGIAAWRGKPVTFAALRGKVVLVDFWGYWCGPCVREMPTLMALDEKYREKGLAIVGVHVDDEVTTPAKLEEKMAILRKEAWGGKDIAFPVAIADGKELQVEGIGQPVRGEVAAEYGVRAYPTTVVIDREGKVAGMFDGQDEKGAGAAVEKLLGK